MDYHSTQFADDPETPPYRVDRPSRMLGKVDRRSLRHTGRTAHFQFRCKPELKDKIRDAANDAGMSIAEWMEHATESAMK